MKPKTDRQLLTPYSSRLIAALLALCLSGAGCLAACVLNECRIASARAQTTAAETSQNAPTKTEAEHTCCRARLKPATKSATPNRERSRQLPSAIFGQSEAAENCCALAGLRADFPRNPRLGDAAFVAAVHPLRLASTFRHARLPRIVEQRVPSASGNRLHLLNSVFLI